MLRARNWSAAASPPRSPTRPRRRKITRAPSSSTSRTPRERRPRSLRLADAYDQGAAAAQRAIAADKAEKEARRLAQEGHAASAAQVAELTDDYVRLAQAQEQVKEAQTIQGATDQLAYIQNEKDLISATAEQRERELAALKETQRILAAGGDPTTGRGARSVSLAAEVAGANAELAKQKSVMGEIGTMATQVFDQVGSAITNAFTSDVPVKWGSVVKAVMASVLQEVAKLAIINPLLNSLVGGNRTTLSDVTGLLGSSAGGSSGGSSVLGSLSNVLGLGMNGAKLFGYDLTGSLPSLSGIMGTTLWGGTTAAGLDAVPALMAGGSNGMIAEGAISSAGVSAMPGATIGGLLGGVGLGFGAGSLLGSLINPAHSTQSTVGAGVGAAAGAAIGSIIPGIGTVIGGLIGGLLGGGSGSFFGPGPAHHGWGYHVETDANGQLVATQQMIDPVAQQQFASEQQQMAQFNAYMASAGLKASGTYIVGGNNGDLAGISPDLASGFNALQFSTSNSGILSRILDGRAFSGTDALSAAVSYAGTYDQLTAKPAPNIGALQTQIDALNKTFGDAIAKARDYGLAEDDLSAARSRQIADLQAQADKTRDEMNWSLQARIATATGDTTTGQRMNFDLAANKQRDDLTAQLVSVYGDAYTATSDYNYTMGLLNDALFAERKQIVDAAAATQDSVAATKARTDATNASARSLLADLTIGNTSARAPEQRYFAGLSLLNDAKQQLDAGGALSDYTTVAQQVLPVARDFLGTSQRYAALVADVASTVASKGGDTAGLGSLLQAQVDGTDALRDTPARYGQQQVDVASATLTELRRLASTLEALIGRRFA